MVACTSHASLNVTENTHFSRGYGLGSGMLRVLNQFDFCSTLFVGYHPQPGNFLYGELYQSYVYYTVVYIVHLLQFRPTKIGTGGGTRITITGSDLGSSFTDVLAIRIANEDCDQVEKEYVPSKRLGKLIFCKRRSKQ